MIKDLHKLADSLRAIGLRITKVGVGENRFECEFIPVKPVYQVLESVNKVILSDTTKEGSDRHVCSVDIPTTNGNFERTRAVMKINRIKELLEKDDANAV